MKLHAVESSNLQAVGWSKGTLTVAFRSGAVYRFSSVPREVYMSLLRAESKGRFFSSHVRGTYEYERIDLE